MIMRELMTRLRSGRKLLPDFLCISFVVLSTTLIPKFYNLIPIVLLRMILAMILALAIAATIGVLLFRSIERHEKDGGFHGGRCAVVLILTCILALLAARYSATSGLQGTAASSIYPIPGRPTYLVALHNSIVFGITTQLIFTAIGSGYEEHKSFLIKLLKTLLYVALPLALMTFVLTQFLPKLWILQMVLTIVLWCAALLGNELVDGQMPSWLHFGTRKQLRDET